MVSNGADSPILTSFLYMTSMFMLCDVHVHAVALNDV